MRLLAEVILSTFPTLFPGKYSYIAVVSDNSACETNIPQIVIKAYSGTIVFISDKIGYTQVNFLILCRND